jgi:hypothetical protein
MNRPPRLMLVPQGQEPPIFAIVTYDDLESLLANRESPDAAS